MAASNVTSISSKLNQPQSITLDEVIVALQNWRNNKINASERIPTKIWDQIFILLHTISASKICKAAGISSAQFRKAKEEYNKRTQSFVDDILISTNLVVIVMGLAEREGFEPSIRCRIHTFQACAFSHSATSPLIAEDYTHSCMLFAIKLYVLDYALPLYILGHNLQINNTHLIKSALERCMTCWVINDKIYRHP